MELLHVKSVKSVLALQQGSVAFGRVADESVEKANLAKTQQEGLAARCTEMTRLLAFADAHATVLRSRALSLRFLAVAALDHTETLTSLTQIVNPQASAAALVPLQE